MNSILPPHIEIEDICFYYKRHDEECAQIVMHYRYNVMEYNGRGCLWTAEGQIMECKTLAVKQHQGYKEQN